MIQLKTEQDSPIIADETNSKNDYSSMIVIGVVNGEENSAHNIIQVGS